MNDLLKKIHKIFVTLPKKKLHVRHLVVLLVVYVLAIGSTIALIGVQEIQNIATEALTEMEASGIPATQIFENQIALIIIVGIVLSVFIIILLSFIVKTIINKWKKTSLTTIEVINVYVIAKISELLFLIAGAIAAGAASIIFKNEQRTELLQIMSLFASISYYTLLIWGLRVLIARGTKKK